MKNILAQKAISAALKCDWESAVKINSKILQNYPSDIDAMNRLAKAYFETGKDKEALKLSEKVLELDPTNKIALRCKAKYSNIKNENGNVSNKLISTQNVFLEEPGKTKVVSLINLGEKELRLGLDCGERVSFSVGKHKLSVTTDNGRYVGRVPDDLSSRIINIINSGGKYEVFVKSATEAEVAVLIREIRNIDGGQSEISFPTEKRA